MRPAEKDRKWGLKKKEQKGEEMAGNTMLQTYTHTKQEDSKRHQITSGKPVKNGSHFKAQL